MWEEALSNSRAINGAGALGAPCNFPRYVCYFWCNVVFPGEQLEKYKRQVALDQDKSANELSICTDARLRT